MEASTSSLTDRTPTVTQVITADELPVQVSETYFDMYNFPDDMNLSSKTSPERRKEKRNRAAFIENTQNRAVPRIGLRDFLLYSLLFIDHMLHNKRQRIAYMIVMYCVYCIYCLL